MFGGGVVNWVEADKRDLELVWKKVARRDILQPASGRSELQLISTSALEPFATPASMPMWERR
jgi:hypothetical protein